MPLKVKKVKISKKIIFPDFLKAIKKGDKKVLLQAKKQRYKINLYWLVENHKKVKSNILDYLMKNGMIEKSTKNLDKLLENRTKSRLAVSASMK
jgi:hypothetical protein